jgi:hypothetical protein
MAAYSSRESHRATVATHEAMWLTQSLQLDSYPHVNRHPVQTIAGDRSEMHVLKHHDSNAGSNKQPELFYTRHLIRVVLQR